MKWTSAFVAVWPMLAPPSELTSPSRIRLSRLAPFRGFFSSSPIRPVQATVLDRLRYVLWPECGYVLPVGNGAGDLQNTIVGAGAESWLRPRPLDQTLAVS